MGRTVQIHQSTFTVIGVMQAKVHDGHVQRPRQEPGPHARHHLQVDVHRRQPGNLVYKPASPAVADQAKASIYRVLERKYRFDPEDDRAVGIWDTRENQRITDNISLGIQLFLGIIGALTLLVGGMGVANIMYAVVKERTREIGVKMALGAKMRQVMAPFVLEALLMTVIGGILGTLAALALMAGIAALPLNGDAFEMMGRPTFSPAIALATTLILGSIGTLAGYFPGAPRGQRQPGRVLAL